MEPRFSRFCNTLFQGGESIFPCPVSPSSWAAHPKKFFWRYLNAGIKPTATCIPEHSGYLGQFCLVRRGGCAITKRTRCEAAQTGWSIWCPSSIREQDRV